jgi:hypothetical protein
MHTHKQQRHSGEICGMSFSGSFSRKFFEKFLELFLKNLEMESFAFKIETFHESFVSSF